MVDFGFTEKPTHSLFPQTNRHGSRLSKNVFDMKTKLYDIQRCTIFKVFICLYTHFLSHCVDAFTVHVKRGSCNKMYFINNKPIHTNICNNTLKKKVFFAEPFLVPQRTFLKTHYYILII